MSSCQRGPIADCVPLRTKTCVKIFEISKLFTEIFSYSWEKTSEKNKKINSKQFYRTIFPLGTNILFLTVTKVLKRIFGKWLCVCLYQCQKLLSEKRWESLLFLLLLVCLFVCLFIYLLPGGLIITGFATYLERCFPVWQACRDCEFELRKSLIFTASFHTFFQNRPFMLGVVASCT